MHKNEHRLITTEALHDQLSQRALATIISANLYQDRLAGQVGHDEFHFDNNAFAKGDAYIQKSRNEVHIALENGDVLSAWNAFGRLTHTAQDFYAHSNYVTLWLDRFPPEGWPNPEVIDPLDRDLLAGPLRSGRIYPLEPLSWIPPLKRFILPLLPRDAHGWMNLDTADQGPKYAYAFAAALKRTRYEFNLTTQTLESKLLIRFMDKILPEV